MALRAVAEGWVTSGAQGRAEPGLKDVEVALMGPALVLETAELLEGLTGHAFVESWMTNQ